MRSREQVCACGSLEGGGIRMEPPFPPPTSLRLGLGPGLSFFVAVCFEMGSLSLGLAVLGLAKKTRVA